MASLAWKILYAEHWVAVGQFFTQLLQIFSLALGAIVENSLVSETRFVDGKNSVTVLNSVFHPFSNGLYLPLASCMAATAQDLPIVLLVVGVI